MKKIFYLRFKAILSFIVFASFIHYNESSSAQTVTIGSMTPSTTTYQIPINNFYNFCYSQQILLSSEIGMSGFINTIRFRYNGAAPLTAGDNWIVYLGTTPHSTFASGTSWIPLSDLTEVFSGTVTIISDWVEVTLSSPYLYDMSSGNLVVAVDENESGYEGSVNVFPINSAPSRSIYYRSDSANPDPASPPTGTVYSYHNTIQLDITPPIGCEEVDLDAGALTSFDICPSTSFAIVNSGTTMAAGLTRIWQMRSPAGTGTWEIIPGAAAPNYYSASGITSDTEYRTIVNCAATGESDTTNIAIVTTLSYLECYCTPVSTNSNYYIDNFTTSGTEGDISNLESGYSPGGYGIFTDMQVTQFPDFPVNFEVTFGSSSTYTFGFAMWVDWNLDGAFSLSERVFVSSGYLSTHTGTFTVPAETLPGEYRMRIIGHYSSSIPEDPCPSSGNFEVEDYIVNVIPLPLCSDPDYSFPSSAAAMSSNVMVCGTGESVLNLEELMPTASGITYQWQQSSSATGPWSNVGDVLSSPDLLVSVSGDTYFRCLIYCEGDLVLTSSSTFIESVIPVIPVLSSGQHCGPGSVELTGTVGSGDIFWYDVPAGGIPIGSGTTFMTPEIDMTTTYYASGGAYPSVLAQVGTGTLSSTTAVGPFSTYYRRRSMQLMYKADQIADGGGYAGIVNDIRFNLLALPAHPLPDYTISIKMVPSTMATLAWQTDGFIEIFGGDGFSYMPSETGWQVFPIAGGFMWDGESHIVIKVCWGQIPSWVAAGTNEYTVTTGQMLHYQDDTSPGSSCGMTGALTSTFLPNIRFNFAGCESERLPVEAFIRDTPVINIMEEDGVYCLFNNEFTLHSYPEAPAGHTLLWNTGETTPSITVGPSSPDTKFWVEIANEWGCTNSDTATLTLNPSPVVDLGPDVLICEGGTVTLDAGPDGMSYFWNTGGTTREITVEEDGFYTVLVTNSYGCMATDTIYVEVDGYAPQISGIIVDNLSSNTFRFTPHLPMYIDSYEWDFGDGSPVQTISSPVHTYSGPGTYLVTCTVTSSCATVEYTTYTNIFTDIDNVLIHDMLKVYPNPTNDYITIEADGTVHMETIRVTNILGQNVLEESDLRSQKSVKLDVTRLPSGTYHVNIKTDKGEAIKTFQVIK